MTDLQTSLFTAFSGTQITEIEDNDIGRGFFKESKEVIKLLTDLTLCSPFPVPLGSREEDPQTWMSVCYRLSEEDRMVNKVVDILKPYAAQPKLLDPCLGTIIHSLLNKLIVHIRYLFESQPVNSTTSSDEVHLEDSLLSYDVDPTTRSNPSILASYMTTLRILQDLDSITLILYTLCTVEKPKVITQFFYTEVFYLDLVLCALEQMLTPTIICSDTSRFLRHPMFSVFQYEIVADPRSNVHHRDAISSSFGTRQRQYGSFETAPQEATILQRTYSVIEQCYEHATVAVQKAAGTLMAKFFSISDISKLLDRYLCTALRPYIVINFSAFPFGIATESHKRGVYVRCSPKHLENLLTEFPQRYTTFCLKILTDDCQTYHENIEQHQNRTLAHLYSLKAVLKTERQELPDWFLTELVGILIGLEDRTSSTKLNALLRKYCTSILGYSLLGFLPRKNSRWRYRQKKKGLFGAILSDTVVRDEREDCISPEALRYCERGIDYLLRRLEDPLLGVRWAAAKRLADVVSRLPQTLASDIVSCVIQLVAFADSRTEAFPSPDEMSMRHEAASNGAFLTLAGLIRKGCVLPDKLHQLMDLLFLAITYEPLAHRHNYDVAIRDAACYVCWAIARSYSPDCIKPFVAQILNVLVCVSLFDRDINCRRAASAALQEHIGRQCDCVNEIPLITLINYYSISTRRGAYLHVAHKVAQLGDYQNVLMKFLLSKKLICSDTSIRELTYQAIIRLALFCPLSSVLQWIEELERQAVLGINEAPHNVRHGSILGLAALIEMLLVRTQVDSTFTVDAPSHLICALRNVVPKIEKARGYRGRGGDLIRQSACYYLKSICWADSFIPFKPVITIQRYFQTVSQGLRHLSSNVQLAAVECLYALAKRRCSHDEAESFLAVLWKELELGKHTTLSRQGFLLGIGALSERCMENNELCAEAEMLIGVSNQSDTHDAGTRQAALVSLALVLQAIIKHSNHCNGIEINHIECITCIPWETLLNTLMKTSVDYQTDKRGDVGSWVREVTLEISTSLLEILCVYRWTVRRINDDIFDDVVKWASILINIILRQATDKLSRLRSRSLYLLYRCLLNYYSCDIINCLTSKGAESRPNEMQWIFPHLSAEYVFRRVYCFYSYELASPYETAKVEDFIKKKKYLQQTTEGNHELHHFIPFGEIILGLIINIIGTSKKLHSPTTDSDVLPTVDATAFEMHSDVQDVNDSDNLLERVCNISVETSSLGTFVNNNCYDYVSYTKLKKSTMAMKLNEFNHDAIIIKNLLYLLKYKEYRISVLEGLTNTLGHSCSSITTVVANEFNNFISSVMGCSKDATTELPGISLPSIPCLEWAVNIVVSVILLRAPQRFLSLHHKTKEAPILCGTAPPSYRVESTIHNEFRKKESIIQDTRDQLTTRCFQGVPFHHLLGTLDIMVNVEELHPFLPEIQNIIPLCRWLLVHSTHLNSIRPAIRLCYTYSYASSIKNTSVSRKCLLSCLLTLIHSYPILRESTCKLLYSKFFLWTQNEFIDHFEFHPSVQLDTFLETLSSVRWWAEGDDVLHSLSEMNGPPGVTLKEFLDRYSRLSKDNGAVLVYEAYTKLHHLLFTLGLLEEEEIREDDNL